MDLPVQYVLKEDDLKDIQNSGVDSGSVFPFEEICRKLQQIFGECENIQSGSPKYFDEVLREIPEKITKQVALAKGVEKCGKDACIVSSADDQFVFRITEIQDLNSQMNESTKSFYKEVFCQSKINCMCINARIAKSRMIDAFVFPRTGKSKLGVCMYKKYDGDAENYFLDLILNAKTNGDVGRLKEFVSKFGPILRTTIKKLHTCHIVHGDISLSNFLYDKHGSWYISDFGDAHVFAPCRDADLDTRLIFKSIKGDMLPAAEARLMAAETKSVWNLYHEKDGQGAGLLIDVVTWMERFVQHELVDWGQFSGVIEDISYTLSDNLKERWDEFRENWSIVESDEE